MQTEILSSFISCYVLWYFVFCFMIFNNNLKNPSSSPLNLDLGLIMDWDLWFERHCCVASISPDSCLLQHSVISFLKPAVALLIPDCMVFPSSCTACSAFPPAASACLTPLHPSGSISTPFLREALPPCRSGLLQLLALVEWLSSPLDVSLLRAECLMSYSLLCFRIGKLS